MSRFSDQPFPADSRVVADLICAWKDEGDRAARDRVIRSYAPMVKYLVTRKLKSLPSHCELDDLVSCGLFALMQSIDRFDPSRGSFETYAWNRVSGAILDELRRMDWAPRSLRSRGRKIASTRDALQRRTGDVPTNSEVAEAMGLSVEALESCLSDLDRAEVVSLHTTPHRRDGAESPMSELGAVLEADPTQAGDPEMAVLASERARVLRTAIGSLSEREKMTLYLMHVQELTGSEAGSVIGVSESRVSQILAGIRRKLKRHLDTSDAADLFDLAA